MTEFVTLPEDDILTMLNMLFLLQSPVHKNICA